MPSILIIWCNAVPVSYPLTGVHTKNQPGSRMVLTDELYESTSLDDNELTAVDGRCVVLPWSQRGGVGAIPSNPLARKRGAMAGDEVIFYCRYVYDPVKCVLRPQGDTRYPCHSSCARDQVVA